MKYGLRPDSKNSRNSPFSYSLFCDIIDAILFGSGNMKQHIFFTSLCFVLATSCSTILVNTTGRDGIQENPARRTAGAVIEDRSIETIVAVNLKADNQAFREARFNVVSHNGVVRGQAKFRINH